MDDLILNNTKLIYFVLKKYKLFDNPQQREDYYDVGIIGLVKAAKNYDENKGYTFSTYAIRVIENEILIVRRKEFNLKRGGGIPDISLYTPLNDDKKPIELIDSIPSDIDVEKEIIGNEELWQLYEEIDKLSEKEKYILCSIFELEGYKRLTQKQLSEKLNKSQPQVSRVLNKIIKKLRKKLGGD